MRLIKVQVTNYRSIHNAKVDSISDVTTLIGANNEGKTNILRAIRLGLSALADIQYFSLRRRSGSIRVRGRSEDPYYDWELDFPVSKQDARGDKETTVKFEFELNDGEISDFEGRFGIKINGRIPVVLSFGKGPLKIDIPKQGPSKAVFQKNEVAIATWVSRKLRFVHIPAIRTADTAHEIITSLVNRRIREAEAPILLKIENELAVARESAFSEIADELSGTLARFVPNIKKVQISQVEGPRRSAEREQYIVEVDDGTLTPIFQKGDGVQSLATLALMRAPVASRSSSANVIYAIEEPEAHLHSEAIHQVRSVIDARTPDSQVIITTHSPIFVQRRNISSNIIVEDSEARPASSVEEIRKALGVRPPENLVNASVVILCEGQLDCDFLRCYLCGSDPEISSRVDNGEIGLVDIDGAGNLDFYIRHYIGLSCEVFAFLDNDSEGKNAFEKACERGLIDRSRIRLTAHSKRSDSELEDMFPIGVIASVLKGWDLLPDQEFWESRAKFTYRVMSLAKRTGTVLLERDLHKIKLDFAALSFEGLKPEDEASTRTLGNLTAKLKDFFA